MYSISSNIDRSLAYHVVKGALGMEVQSARHIFEEPVANADPDAVLNQLDAYLREHKNGRALEAPGYPLSWLPGLLYDAGLISKARTLEMTRIDLTS